MCGYENRLPICIINSRMQGLELNTECSCLCKKIVSLCVETQMFVSVGTHTVMLVA